MNTIQEQWNSFAQAAIPASAPAVQRSEMKRAFYAGAEAMMRIQYTIGGKDISEAAAMHILDGCQQETHDFARLVASGKA